MFLFWVRPTLIQRFNILAQFTLVTLLATIILSAGLSYTLEKQTRRELIRNHIEIYPSVINALAADHPDFYDFFKAPPGSRPTESVLNLLEDLAGFGKVYRVKVWNRAGTIVWSDVESLIGLAFPENRHFREAAAGQVSYELAQPVKSEHVYEKKLHSILEIYTPIVKDRQVIGIVELYESDRELFANISNATNQMRWTIATSGAILYLVLFTIYLTAHLRHERAVKALDQAQDATIYSLAYQAELRDIETGLHLERTTRYLRILADELRRQKKHLDILTGPYINDLVKSSPLHDIGKSGVSDTILYKPHQLTDAEFSEMKKHCEYGAQIIEKAKERLPEGEFLQIAREITLYHHERWDGNGYPHGLKEEAIPLSARIMALADVYDALRSVRYYKDELPHEQCVAMITERSGSQFDPDVVNAFLAREKIFRKISEQLADKPEDLSGKS